MIWLRITKQLQGKGKDRLRGRFIVQASRHLLPLYWENVSSYDTREEALKAISEVKKDWKASRNEIK